MDPLSPTVGAGIAVTCLLAGHAGPVTACPSDRGGGAADLRLHPPPRAPQPPETGPCHERVTGATAMVGGYRECRQYVGPEPIVTLGPACTTRRE
jgi:hypothetical protein